MKYGKFTLGEIEALINILGEDVVYALLRGEIEFEIREVIRKLFDKNGRRIPPKGLKAAVCDPNKDFQLVQPGFGYEERLAQLVRYFPKGTEFPSAEEFKARSEALVDQLRSDKFLANLLSGVYLPICLPRIESGDYGRMLEEVFIASAERAYKAEFPDRAFNNYRKGELSGQVSIISGSRHEKLIAEMGKGPVVGIQFFSLRGFSINASREQMESLPESCLLSGAIDFMTALAMYPDVLAGNWNTPGYLCSANSWRSGGYSLNAEAYDDSLGFDFAGHLAGAYAYFSSGLLFLGCA